MSTTKRVTGLRLAAVAISCTALTGATLGTAIAARSQPAAAAIVSPGWAHLLRIRLLVAETTGADADELDVLNGLIEPDDQDEVEAPDEVETPEVETPDTETPEVETPDTEQDDQGDDNDDQGENEQDEADAGEHDAAEHDGGDSGEHDDGESGGD